ncbi:MAG: metalloregulator ArsR/SmtB family transcription factor [Pseudomonadota bacterium]
MSLIASDKPPEEAGGRRTKDRLLLLLKSRGSQTTKDLAEALEISVPATRRHLESLSDLVYAEQESGAVGRPAQRWHLTDAAQGRFPDTHSELTVKLLETIEHTLGRDALDAVIAERARETEAAYLALITPMKSLAGRLRRLTELRSQEGYMAEIEKTEDGWLLLENHCPICAAARACQGFCRSELELFRKVLGPKAQVERVEYVLEGGRRCAYRVTST